MKNDPETKSRKQSIVKAAFIMTMVSGVSSVVSFAREMVIAYVFGAGAVTDAYNVAMRVASTAGLLVSTYFMTVFIPSYVRTREKHGDKKALLVANNALGVSFVINIVLMLVLHLSAHFILGIITGFEEKQLAITVTAVNIVLFQLPVTTFVSFFGGYLNARKSFLGPVFAVIPKNILIIIIIFLFGAGMGVTGLSLARVLSVCVSLLALFFWVFREKYKFTLSIRFNTPEMRNDLMLLFPVMIGSALSDLKAWVDTVIASFLGEGMVAAVGFSSHLLIFVRVIVIMPVTGVIFSYLSEYAAKGDKEKMFDILWKAVRVLLFILLPIVIIAIPSSMDIVKIVYERGQFDADATLITGAALRWYLPGLLFIALHMLLTRMSYGVLDSKTPVISASVAMIINIGLSIWLSGIYGIGGLAFATSVGHCVAAILLFVLIRRKFGALDFLKTAKDIFKMAVCVLPCVALVILLRGLLHENHVIIRFVTVTAAGGIIYLISAYILKVSVLNDTLLILRKRFGR